MTESEAAAWFILRSHPQAETEAARRLGRQGFTAYVPHIWKRMRPQGATKREERQVPLFPGYLFALDPWPAPWLPMRATRGVADVLTYPDGRPKALPESALREIMLREDLGGGAVRAQKPQPETQLRPGETVRLDLGHAHPFDGHSGIFQEDDRGRVTVLLDILGRMTEISLPSEAVARV